MADRANEDAAIQRELLELRAQRAALEARLHEFDERFHALVEGAFEGLTLSVEGKIVETNAAFARMLGYGRDELLGKTPSDLATAASAALVVERVLRGDETPYEVIGVRKDGSTFPCEVLGRNIVFQGRPARLAAFRDLSDRYRVEAERRRLEERLAQAQKLETLAALTGGIAHDFSNLALIVLGHAELALALPELVASARGHLEEIRVTALRAGELVAEMLAYAGRSSRRSDSVDLSAVVRAALAEPSLALGPEARLELTLDPALPTIEADREQLRQVVANLVGNAAEALEARPGVIKVRTVRATIAERELREAALDATRGPGEYALLEVADTGVGMDRSTAARVFEPFFSTKFKGRGLGMAAVLGIVRAHAGAIALASEPGRGTTVRVMLPLAAGAAPAQGAPVPEPAKRAPVRAEGFVLVADDERMLRDISAEILRTLGFEVLLARDGVEALEIVRARHEQIRLLVLDATMPRMGGIDALRAIRELGFAMPAIVMSGFGEPDADELAPDPRVVFLAKPFEINTLLAKVSELLARA